MNPASLLYTKEHEWIEVQGGNRARIGITEYAQKQLGDIVFVELPEVGREYDAGQTFGVVESVKAVSDIYMPVAAKVIEVNKAVVDKPELVNSAPFADGWMIAIEIKDPGSISSLLKSADYDNFLGGLSH